MSEEAYYWEHRVQYGCYPDEDGPRGVHLSEGEENDLDLGPDDRDEEAEE